MDIIDVLIVEKRGEGEGEGELRKSETKRR
jgi:hypothetical protein